MTQEALKSDAYGQALFSAWRTVRGPGLGGDAVPHPVFVQGFTAGWNASPAAQPGQDLVAAALDWLYSKHCSSNAHIITTIAKSLTETEDVAIYTSPPQRTEQPAPQPEQEPVETVKQ